MTDLASQWEQTTNGLISARPRQLNKVFGDLHRHSRDLIVTSLPTNERLLIGFSGFLHSGQNVGSGRVGPEVGLFDFIVTSSQMILIGIVGKGNEPILENRLFKDISGVTGTELKGSLRKRFFIMCISHTDGDSLLISGATMESSRSAFEVLEQALADFQSGSS
jgi:hypothetical protein